MVTRIGHIHRRVLPFFTGKHLAGLCGLYVIGL
jgi:hypothetical protein